MEGPSLVIAAEELQQFVGKKVVDLIGNTKIDKDRMCYKKIERILSWGKHLIIEFDSFSIRVHFLMYGSYRVNKRKEDTIPRLSIVFDNKQEINFYNCSIKFIEGENVEKAYDWRIDIMSTKWNAEYVYHKVKEHLDDEVADILMNQDIFAGVGNIIKNEVLFNLRLNPEEKIQELTDNQIRALVQEARDYSFNFYAWKKEYTLKKHWQIFRKSICPIDKTKVMRKKTGTTQRWSYYCPVCQQ